MKITKMRYGDQDAETLVIGTSSGVFRATFDQERRLDACAAGDVSCARVVELAGVHDVGVVDYDIDGLDDLIVSFASEAVVVRQRGQDEVAVEAEIGGEERE